jgi:hypothetical protein
MEPRQTEKFRWYVFISGVLAYIPAIAIISPLAWLPSSWVSAQLAQYSCEYALRHITPIYCSGPLLQLQQLFAITSLYASYIAATTLVTVFVYVKRNSLKLENGKRLLLRYAAAIPITILIAYAFLLGLTFAPFGPEDSDLSREMTRALSLVFVIAWGPSVLVAILSETGQQPARRATPDSADRESYRA